MPEVFIINFAMSGPSMGAGNWSHAVQKLFTLGGRQMMQPNFILFFNKMVVIGKHENLQT